MNIAKFLRTAFFRTPPVAASELSKAVSQRCFESEPLREFFTIYRRLEGFLSNFEGQNNHAIEYFETVASNLCLV